MMKIKISYVVCVTLLCLALIEARKEQKSLQLKNANQRKYCNYYGDIFYSNSFRFFSGDYRSCTDSFAYSIDSKYIVIELANIKVNCNGDNDIQLKDYEDQEWRYCSGDKLTTHTFVTESEWVGIRIIGRVSFLAEFVFTNIYQPIVVPTNPPIVVPTNPPIASDCGSPAVKPQVSSKIVGGQIAVANSWPWQVGFKENQRFFCGGSLINDQWILTAAHCIKDFRSLDAHLGDHNILADNSGETVYKAEKWITNPNYDGEVLNDIALVKLANKVTFTDKISPICLPNEEPSVNQIGVVTGWGTTKADGSGEISANLKQATIPINEDYVCGWGTLPDTQICAGVNDRNDPRDSCQGDSGGPFVRFDNGKWYQVGIVSYGYQCGGGGVYTNVYKFNNWITETIKNN